MPKLRFGNSCENSLPTPSTRILKWTPLTAPAWSVRVCICRLGVKGLVRGQGALSARNWALFRNVPGAWRGVWGGFASVLLRGSRIKMKNGKESSLVRRTIVLENIH